MISWESFKILLYDPLIVTDVIFHWLYIMEMVERWRTISGKKRFIAVVDDEDDLVYLYKDALSQIEGFKVFAFTDPLLALEHFRTNHQHYAIVISDYRMPGLNGVQLFEKIKEINPQVSRMLISAFEIQDKLFSNCDCVDKFLQKPIAMKDLISQVQMYLSPIKAQ